MPITDERPPTGAEFYITGGTLQPDARSYVERQADTDLYDGLHRGDYCYVLTSRQMGKSSLMIQTAARLRQDGAAVAILDLTAVGQNLSVDQWYGGLIRRLGRQLDSTGKLEDELEEFWEDQEQLGPLQRWMAAIERVALPWVKGAASRTQAKANGADASGLKQTDPSLIVFIDEIDAVRSLPFSSDEFFAGIRECFNRRSQDDAFKRLTFCLLGVATPADLISDSRTSPFNIGRRIEVRDFSAVEALPLAEGLSSDKTRAEALLSRVLYWTGGQPYLTQRLCRAVADASGLNPQDALRPVAAFVDSVCDGVFLSRTAREVDDNLAFVRNRLLRSEVDLASLLDLYQQVQRGQRIPDDDTDALSGVLRLSGVVKVVDGLLKTRNRIYERVFDHAWIVQHMPGAELRRQRVAFRRGLARAGTASALVIAAMGVLAGVALSNAKVARTKEHTAQGLSVSLRRALASEKRARNLERAERGSLEVAVVNALTQGKRANAEAGRANMQAGLAKVAAARAGSEAVRANHEAGLATEKALEAKQEKAGAEEARGRAEEARGQALDGAERLRNLLYVAQVNLAQQAVTAGNGARAYELLEAQQPGKGQRDLRGFDWRYTLKTTMGGADALLGGHLDAIHGIAYSPDGETLATGSFDGTIRLWDVGTQKARFVLRTHGKHVNCVAFSRDGRTIAAGCQDNLLRLWDVRSGELIERRAGQDGPINCMAFSPDGTSLATGSDDQTVSLWDGRGQRVTAILRGFRHQVDSLAYSPDGRTLAAVSSGDDIRLIDLPTRVTVGSLPMFPPNSDYHHKVSSLAFSPDGKTLAAGSWAAKTYVWDMATLKLRWVLSSLGSIQDVKYSPDGSLLTVAGNYGIALYSTRTGKRLAEESAGGGSSLAAAFSPNGERLAVGGGDGATRVWRTAALRGDRSPRSVRMYPSDVYGSAISPDGKTLVTAGADGLLKVYEAAIGRPLSTYQCTSPLRSVAFSPDGRLVAAGASDGRILVWNTSSRKVTFLSGHLGLGTPTGLAFFPDGKRLASCSAVGVYTTGDPGVEVYFPNYDNTLRIWDLESGRLLDTIDDWATCVAFSPDGKLLAEGTTEFSGRVLLRDSATLKMVRQLGNHSGAVRGIAFTPDGKSVLSVGDDNYLRIWSAAGDKALVSLGVADGRNYPTSVVVSPDGKTAAVGAIDNAVHLYDLATAMETGNLYGHSDNVLDVVFMPDGTLVSSGRDRTVRYWDVKTRQETRKLLGTVTTAMSPDGKELAQGAIDGLRWGGIGAPEWLTTVDLQGARVNALAFSPDGRTLAAGVGPRSVMLWDSRTGRRIFTLAAPANFLSFSPDGRLLAAGKDRSITLWDVARGEKTTTFQRAGLPIKAMAFSDDSRLLADGREDGAVNLWDVRGTARMTSFHIQADALDALAFAPAGTGLAVGTGDATVEIWDTAHFRLLDTLRGHRGTVLSLAFSPDRRTLATGSADNSVKLWSLGARKGQEVVTLATMSNPVTLTRFSRDGSVLETGSEDVPAQFWRALSEPASSPALRSGYARPKEKSTSANAAKRSRHALLRHQPVARVGAIIIPHRWLCGKRPGSGSRPAGAVATRSLPNAHPVARRASEPQAAKSLIESSPALWKERRLEAEDLRVVESIGCQVNPQSMVQFQPGLWSNDGQLLAASGDRGARGLKAGVEVGVLRSGVYRLGIRYSSGADYGIVQASMDQQNVGAPVDLFSGSTDTASVHPLPEVAMGEVRLAAGNHRLAFESIDKNPKSNGYQIGIDYVTLSFVRDAPTLPDPHGDFYLNADNAGVEGSDAFREGAVGTSDIGGWQTSGDFVIWDVEAPRAENYRVEMEYSCPPTMSGGKFRLSMDGIPGGVEGTVESTVGWPDYRVTTLRGTLSLKAGHQVVRLTPGNIPHNFLMNFRRVALRPATAPRDLTMETHPGHVMPVGTLQAQWSAVDPETHLLYVAGGLSNSIIVVDLKSARVVSFISVGGQPEQIALDLTLHRLYVPHAQGNSVAVIDTRSRKILRTLPLPGPAWGVAVNARTHRVYVTHSPDSLLVLDGRTLKKIRTVTLGLHPGGLVVDPVSEDVYVAVYDAGTVDVVDGASNDVKASIEVGKGPYRPSIDPASRRLYVGNWGGSDLCVINMTTNDVIATVPVGKAPASVLEDSRNHRIFVCNMDDNNVTVLSNRGDSVITNFRVGHGPIAMVMDSGRLYVVNKLSDTISVVDPKSSLILQTIYLDSQGYNHNMIARFDSDANWNLEQDGVDTASQRLENNTLVVDVTRVDGTNWHVQALHTGIDMESGHHYTLRFRARASKLLSIVVGAGIDQADWHDIGLSQGLTLGTAWASYEYSFTAKNCIPDHERVAFVLGDAVGTVWLADVELVDRSLYPHRDPASEPGLLDLTDYYNLGLEDEWLEPGFGSLVKLPRGIQQFHGVTFDVRGYIQLSGKGLAGVVDDRYPETMTGVAVHRKCHRLQLLLGARWTAPEGTIIARCVVHYRTGKQAEVPVRYGVDVRDWNVASDRQPGGGVIAWTSPDAGADTHRLYQSKWENPLPEDEIETVDFISTMSNSAPFLVAMTAEE